MKKICAICGKEFDATCGKTKYCSKTCRSHARYKKTREEQRSAIKDAEKIIRYYYERGLHDIDIAKRIGYSKTHVRNIRLTLGLPRQVSKSRLKKEKIKLKNAQMEFRFCNKCGKVFYPIRVNQKFCSKTCEKITNRSINEIKKKRIRKYIDDKTDNISLWAVYEKYHGLCYLCGERCDPEDYEWKNGHKNVHGNYPSREHVIPISKGGSHTWENVRLAHIKCNSSKGARYG